MSGSSAGHTSEHSNATHTVPSGQALPTGHGNSVDSSAAPSESQASLIGVPPPRTAEGLQRLSKEDLRTAARQLGVVPKKQGRYLPKGELIRSCTAAIARERPASSQVLPADLPAADMPPPCPHSDRAGPQTPADSCAPANSSGLASEHSNATHAVPSGQALPTGHGDTVDSSAAPAESQASLICVPPPRTDRKRREQEAADRKHFLLQAAEVKRQEVLIATESWTGIGEEAALQLGIASWSP